MCRESLIDYSKYTISEDGTITSKRFKREMSGAKWKGYITVHMATLKNSWLFFKKHRVIWYYFNGEIPEGMEIDHINTIRDDNRLENLRLVSKKENMNNPITIEKFREVRQGKNNPFYGKKHSQQSIEKMKEFAKKNVSNHNRDKLGRFI